MMQTSKYLWISGSVVFGLLGTVHLILTFFTNSFVPRDQKLIQVLERTPPKLSEEISMWKAWIGFNASHSSGIIFLSVINCFIAFKLFPAVHKSDFYFLFNIATVVFYVFLAAKYWFVPPLIGTCITLACYLVAYILLKL
jgi:hypothetical protein